MGPLALFCLFIIGHAAWKFLTNAEVREMWAVRPGSPVEGRKGHLVGTGAVMA